MLTGVTKREHLAEADAQPTAIAHDAAELATILTHFATSV
jgi:hypothetical protein